MNNRIPHILNKFAKAMNSFAFLVLSTHRDVTTLNKMGGTLRMHDMNPYKSFLCDPGTWLFRYTHSTVTMSVAARPSAKYWNRYTKYVILRFWHHCLYFSGVMWSLIFSVETFRRLYLLQKRIEKCFRLIMPLTLWTRINKVVTLRIHYFAISDRQCYFILFSHCAGVNSTVNTSNNVNPCFSSRTSWTSWSWWEMIDFFVLVMTNGDDRKTVRHMTVIHCK